MEIVVWLINYVGVSISTLRLYIGDKFENDDSPIIIIFIIRDYTIRASRS